MTTLSETAGLQRTAKNLLTETDAERRIQNQVISEAGLRSRAEIDAELNEAQGLAEGSFRSAEGTLARRQRGLGQPLSESELRVQNRRLGLGRALSSVDARNRAVGSMRERQDIARTGAAGLRSIVEGDILGVQSTQSRMAASRRAEYETALAEHEAKKNQALGSIASIGLSFVPGGAFLAPAVGGAIANRG